MLEENTGKLKEELAGARSRQEELSRQLQTLRGRLPFPDQDGARQKITALQEELQALAATLEQAKKRSQISKRLWLPLMPPSENRRIF